MSARALIPAIGFLLLAACSAIGDMESAALTRAKQPIIVTIYHGHF